MIPFYLYLYKTMLSFCQRGDVTYGKFFISPAVAFNSIKITLSILSKTKKLRKVYNQNANQKTAYIF